MKLTDFMPEKQEKTITHEPKEDTMKVDIKVTLEGQLAVLRNDGFYYSVTPQGTLKREYSVFENLSDPVIRERTKLKQGDLFFLEGSLAFCSSVDDNSYSVSKFDENHLSTIVLNKFDEVEELGTVYSVLINPLDMILKSDPGLDPVTLLSNVPENASKIALTLQVKQTQAIQSVLKQLK